MTVTSVRPFARPALAVVLLCGAGLVSACGSDTVRRTEQTTTTTTAAPVVAPPPASATQTTTTHTQGY